MKLIQTVRGMRDLANEDILYYNSIIEIARAIGIYYNYEELSLPILEYSEIFHRSLGETSDVISKETYTFLDRDKTSLTLRPEFTAGVVRSFISNGLTQSLPVKFFSHGPLFRHERPQMGRYRQFSQINFEYFGAKGPHTDLETILLAKNILKEIGLENDIVLQLNSLGDLKSRQSHKEALVAFFKKYEKELSSDSQKRLYKNPLRIFDSKDVNDQKISKDAPQLHDYFSEESKNYYETLKKYLKDLEVTFIENTKIVRGLDYYTHTVFEFVTENLGAQGTVLAGGRYDGLVEMMGGPPTPAIGFAAGIDRLILLMKNKKELSQIEDKISLIPIGENAQEFSLRLSQQLRDNQFSVDNEIMNNIGKMMKRANKINARFAIIFGDDELKNDHLKIKDMKSGQENTVNSNEIVNYCRLALKTK